MPETRFTEFPDNPLTLGLVILSLHRRPMTNYFCFPFIGIFQLVPVSSLQITMFDGQLRSSFGVVFFCRACLRHASGMA